MGRNNGPQKKKKQIKKRKYFHDDYDDVLSGEVYIEIETLDEEDEENEEWDSFEYDY